MSSHFASLSIDTLILQSVNLNITCYPGVNLTCRFIYLSQQIVTEAEAELGMMEMDNIYLTTNTTSAKCRDKKDADHYGEIKYPQNY